ncbi:MAG: M14 family metallopeptidase [Aliarcobacter sp.]|nr:M14 family metallopeptidase [Aliarcobacter sp.]
MKKIEIVTIESLSRAPLVIEGYLFKGSDPKAPRVAIVAAMGGEAILPLYCASRLVDFFKNKIEKEKIKGDILIIPSINHYALNIGKRFWPLDNTDINTMFPGYDLGETTQRIAKKVFDVLNGYDYGIILERRPDPAVCLPYLKLFKSGYEDLKGAKDFGFKMIHHRTVKSIDTVTLQYNWQLWGTKAFSVMCPNDIQIDKRGASQINQGILRFMDKNKIIDYHIFNGYESSVINRNTIEVIKAPKSGIFISKELPGNYVSKGQVIGEIVHSLEGHIVYQFLAPSNGMITCFYSNALIYENAVAFRMARIG